MSSGQVHATEHEAQIDAPAAAVYSLIADVTCWPQVFGPTVHVEVVDTDGASERIRIWATANGEVKSWTSRRDLDAENLRISFRQEASQPPVGGMGGEWRVVPRSERTSTVLLTHDYSAVDDRAEDVAWIARAVDHNSTAELAALKTTAEHVVSHADATLSFDDSVTIQGSAQDVYEFLRDAQRWPERLPHVARLDLREIPPDLQVMGMDTMTKDGSVHTTESIRLCLSPHTIVYKQTKVPGLMSAHTGRWVITEGADGVLATSHHTVVLNPDAVPGILGPTATLPDACAFVRNALGGNSRATLGFAKAYAEDRSHG
jgi:aromatase